MNWFWHKWAFQQFKSFDLKATNEAYIMRNTIKKFVKVAIATTIHQWCEFSMSLLGSYT